jgi:hypothetical protein
MFEIVRAIHQALHTESTWIFVIVISLASGLVGGGTAWIVDRQYKNSLRDGETQVQLSLTCDTVNLPLPHRGDMWFLDTVVFFKGLTKYSPNPLKPDWFWPENDVSGTGFRCLVRNHGKSTAFGVAISLEVSRREIVREPGGGWHSGDVTENNTPVVSVPQPLGAQDSFAFYICDYSDRSLEITFPTFAVVNHDDIKKKAKVELRLASTMGNPIVVAPFIRRRIR